MIYSRADSAVGFRAKIKNPDIQFCAGNKLPLTKMIDVWQYEKRGIDFSFRKINKTEVDYLRKVQFELII